jgi:MFS family permease
MTRLIVAFVGAQMIGWGTTIYLPAVLLDRLRADIGLSAEAVFSGASIMLLASALCAPAVGRAYDRFGTRRFLATGATLIAAGLAVLSQAAGYGGYALAWILVGAGMSLSLTFGMSTTYARLHGAGARRLITITTFFTGVTSTLFMPFTEWSATAFGWRATVAAYAGLALFVSVPLYLWAVPWPRGAVKTYLAAGGDAGRDVARVAPADTRRALVLIGVAFALTNMVSWGMQQQMVELFKAFGMGTAVAVFVVGMKGPAQVAGRLVDLSLSSRYTPFTGAVACIGAMAAALAGLAVLPFGPVTVFAFILAWGVAEGLMTILRPALPLHLFGRARYGSLMGQIMLPMQLASAAAPLLFAAIMTRAGPVLLLAVAAVSCLAALLAALMVVPLMRAPADRGL